MPTETIRFTVNGPNAATRSVQVITDPSGTGSTTFSYTGAASGVDLLQAFLDNRTLSSNQTQAVWQNSNGPISVTPITGYVSNAGSTSVVPPGGSSADYGAPKQYYNSLMYNTHPSNLLPGDPHDSGNQASPVVNNAITSSGYYAGDVVVAGGSFNMVMLGSFVVAAAGQVTFTVYVNGHYVMGCPGATYVSGSNNMGGVSTTPFNGYATVAGFNDGWPGGDWATETTILNFAAPGVYPFEIVWATGVFSEKQFCMLANGAVIPPITAITVPPSPAAGTGNLILTPVTAGPGIVGNQLTVNLAISGLTYLTKTYLPFLEGTPGSVYIYNDPTNPTFTLPAYNGHNIDPVSAAAAIFNLTGSNTNWQSRIGVTYDSTVPAYAISYNGLAFDPGVAATTLTLVQDDVAWYNNSNTTYDVFNATNQGGGKILTIEADYLIRPAVASFTPSSLYGDGNSHTFTVSLAKPIPPLQNTTNCVVTASSSITITSVTPVVDGNGWITSFTVVGTTATVIAPTTVTVTIVFHGNVTYLSLGNIETTDLTYSTQTATVVLNPNLSNPMNAYSFSAVAGGEAYPPLDNPPVVLSATVESVDNGFSTLSFLSQLSGGYGQVTIGTASPTNLRQMPTSGVWLADYTFTWDTTGLTNGSYSLGYVVTDTTSGYSLTTWDSGVYTRSTTVVVGGGGGGGGCPTLDMFVNSTDTVRNLRRGDRLECLLDEDVNQTEFREIEYTDVTLQPCVRIKTENGAEVVVSFSTPVMTFESQQAMKLGHVGDLPAFANEMKKGYHVVTDVGDGPSYSKIIEVEFVGDREVSRLYVGGKNFAAGTRPGFRIFTHNAALPPVSPK